LMSALGTVQMSRIHESALPVDGLPRKRCAAAAFGSGPPTRVRLEAQRQISMAV
jgi:hypothetical protein